MGHVEEERTVVFVRSMFGSTFSLVKFRGARVVYQDGQCAQL